MRKWVEPQEVAVPEALQAAVGGHPLVAQTLARRGLTDPQAAQGFLDPAQYTPTPPTELPGLREAVDRLVRAIQQKKSICVWGDFDVDGQTSTTVLFSTLRELGASVTFHIPVRASESHGVNLPVLKQLLNQGVDVLLTCDTGIAAHEALDYAHKNSVETIVTDHHELPSSLPQADAIVNPQMLPRGHPLRGLPGVGVAYKLAEELYRRFERAGDCEQYLDLAALGIVADVALQTGDTRYLLQRGLHELRNSQRSGIQALLERAELSPNFLTEEHIGFILGPRLNALGRLQDANLAVELLTTADLGRARALALQLESLNERRKLYTNQVFQGALAQIEADPKLLNDPVLVLSHPAWPASVVGIVASRLVERYHKPAVLISAPPGQMGRGSARSVEGIDITALLASQAELLAGYGGHPMAAGFSLEVERIPELRRLLSRAVVKLGMAAAEPVLQMDGYLQLTELSLDLVTEIERLAPFGPGNPSLNLVSRGLSLKSYTTVGREEEHLVLTVEGEEGGATQRVVWWGGAGWPLPEGRFDLAYSVRASTFRGQRDLQVEWVDFRPVEQGSVAVAVKPALQAIDYRQEAHPLPVLQRLLSETAVQVWREADAMQKLSGRNRYELAPGADLVIWSIPPGPDELRQAIDTVQPERVYLFAVDPRLDQVEAFLKRLAGLVKHVLGGMQGQVRLANLAAATGQREVTVQKGLAWLAAGGHLTILEANVEEIRIASGGQVSQAEAGGLAAQLRALLQETAAFRAYYTRADKEKILSPFTKSE
jgi:single-stranded-DNA-specific exonuclease